MIPRTRSKAGDGWLSSAIFNVLAFIIPFLVCQFLVIGYTHNPHAGVASAETLAQTRKDIDRAFKSISSKDETARAEWAALISEKLEERNMSAARGFLLAAPQMLSASDQRAIKVAADAEPFGTEDQRLLRAALLFVPSDIRVKYETSLRPRGIELLNIQEDPEPSTVEIAANTDQSGKITDTGLTSITHTPAFSVLGTVEDLVSRSRDWMRGNRQNAFEMRLTGIAMASPPSATGLEQEPLIAAASLLKTAWRSNRLQPQYARLLSQRLAAAIPEETLTQNLEIALSDVARLEVRAERVQDAFARSINHTATSRLGPEFEQIAQIADATSPRGALSILSHVSNPTDISRARLLAQAGGDRTVALVSQIGKDAFYVNGTGIKWSRAAVITILIITIAFIALISSASVILKRAVFGTDDVALL